MLAALLPTNAPPRKSCSAPQSPENRLPTTPDMAPAMRGVPDAGVMPRPHCSSIDADWKSDTALRPKIVVVWLRALPRKPVGREARATVTAPGPDGPGRR